MPGNRIKLKFTLNEKDVTIECPPGRRLIDIIRLDFKLTGTKEGCGKGECGSCVILMNGNTVNSCIIPAFRLADANIVTIEGLARVKGIPDIRSLFAEIQPLQCGYCASGVQMVLAALLLQNPKPDEREIREALSGNICFCSAYSGLLKSALHVVKHSKKRRYAKRISG